MSYFVDPMRSTLCCHVSELKQILNAKPDLTQPNGKCIYTVRIIYSIINIVQYSNFVNKGLILDAVLTSIYSVGGKIVLKSSPFKGCVCPPMCFSLSLANLFQLLSGTEHLFHIKC